GASCPTSCAPSRRRADMKGGRFTIVMLAALLAGGSAVAQTPAAKPDWMTYHNPYSAADTLASPHRNHDEVAAWVQQAATDTLTFTPADYREKIGGFRKYFTPQGWEPYAGFVRGGGVLDAVATKGYSVSALAGGASDVADEKAVDGLWHWTVKRPITLTLTNGQGSTQTVRYALTLDLVRTGQNDKNGIAISG